MRRTKTCVALFILMGILVCHVNGDIALAGDRANVKVNYVAKLNEIGKAGRDENLNAEPYYKKAFVVYVHRAKQLSLSDIKAWPQDLSGERLALLENWVSANNDAIVQLKLGTEKAYYWPEYQGNLIREAIALPELKQARLLMYAICARAKLNAIKGDFKAAFSDLLACYRFGKHFAGPKTTVEQLVGVSIRAYTVQAAFQILDKSKPALDLLKDFQEQLRQLSVEQSNVIELTFEKFFTLENIQVIFTDDGKGSGRIRKTELKAMKNAYNISEEEMRNLKQLTRQQTVQLAEKMYENLSGLVDQTPYQLHSQERDIGKVIKEMTKDNLLLWMWRMNVGKVVEMSFRFKVQAEALETTISLLRYKADKGHFPVDLQLLVADGYLKKLPMDPYSGGALVYRREDDNFTLYSRGADFDDDAGVRSKWGKGVQGGDQVFWPVE